MENQNPKELKLVAGAILIAALVIGGAIVYIGGKSSNQANSGDNNQVAGGNNQGQQQQQQTVDIKDVKIAGSPFIGNANAPVVMAFWSDYQCPFCKSFDQDAVENAVKDYVNAGKLKIVFKDYAFLGSDSTTAALAARAVWEVAPNKFYDWHKGMMDKQDDENGGWGNKADVLALTASLGIDSVKVGQLMVSKASDYQKLMDADKAEGTSFGINGTPGSIIGKQLISGAQPYAQVKAAIDAVLK